MYHPPKIVEILSSIYSTSSPPSSSVLPPLPTEKPQTPFLSLEGYLTTLGEKEHIALDRFHRLPAFV